ncbi:transcription factor IIA, alpha/beta subunit [Pilobolus umbonatus]|nr:transcription factor IIA, alpha/beta subunit [Pilobolus umbonatus]
MSNAIVSNVYRYVIDDVINQVRDDFEDMGIDESILQELQRSWETKVARSRVANFGFHEETYYEEDTPDIPPVTEERTTPYTDRTENHPIQLAPVKTEEPSPGYYQSPHPYGNRNITYSVPSTSKYPPSDNHKGNLPQSDGSTDEMSTQDIDGYISNTIMSRHQSDPMVSMDTDTSHQAVPMELSMPSSFTFTASDKSTTDSFSSIRHLMQDKRIKKLIPQLDGEDDTKGDEDINSDLDDDDGEGGEDIEHIILCLYEKVTRTKSKWKCVLKDGIMLLNGRDYLFHRANGDFEW